MTRKRLSRMKRILKNKPLVTRCIKVIGRNKDYEPLLDIRGYNDYVPDGRYMLTLYDSMFKHSKFLALSDDNNYYKDFPFSFEKVIYQFW